MGIQLISILDRFPILLKLEQGDQNFTVDRVQSALLAGPNDMVFVSEAKHLDETTKSKSQLWVVQKGLIANLPKDFNGTLVSSSNPYLAMALIGKEFFPLKPGVTPVDGVAIHPSAVIAKTARLGHRVKIGPGAVISDGCLINDDVVIGANSVIEPNVKIGSRTHIHPLVFIGHSCEIGADCEIKSNSTIGSEGFGFAHDQKGQHHRLTHYGSVIIENRVQIGAGVQIDRGTFEDSYISENVIIDNHCHFGHNIRIGRNSTFVGGTLVAGSVSIGANCLFGGRVTISGHLSICDNVQLMGKTAIGKSIDKPGQYGGLPVQPMKDVLKTRAILPLLPQMRKQLLRILKKLEMEE